MIRSVVFDMGGVLLDFSPDEYIARLGYTGKDAQILKEEVFHTPEWCAMDRGSLSPEAGARALEKRVPRHLQKAVRPLVCSWWEGDLMPLPGMGELLEELKKKDYSLYLLSNASKDIYKYFDRLPGSDCFDGLLVSADWLLVKPQTEIFEKLYLQFDLEPGECIFIDDRPDNVETAMYTGMNAILYRRDIERLRRELLAYGVDVSLV